MTDRRRTAADDGILRVHQALRSGFGTEAAVYGTILVSGLVAVSSAHGETSLVVLVTVAVTVLVFWAHMSMRAPWPGSAIGTSANRARPWACARRSRPR